jgi:hypothetical protein
MLPLAPNQQRASPSGGHIFLPDSADSAANTCRSATQPARCDSGLYVKGRRCALDLGANLGS